MAGKYLIAVLLFAIPCSAQNLPPTTKARDKHVADKKFWFVIAGLGAAKTYDLTTTSQWLSTSRTAYEQNPIFGRRPSDARLALIGSGSFLGEIALAYKMKSSHSWVRHIWWLPPAAMASAHVYLGIRNQRRTSQERCWIERGSFSCFH